MTFTCYSHLRNRIFLTTENIFKMQSLQRYTLPRNDTFQLEYFEENRVSLITVQETGIQFHSTTRKSRATNNRSGNWNTIPFKYLQIIKLKN